VSDRESITLSSGDHIANILHARSLQGEEMMPRSAFWAPITASRYLSLFDVDGDDDFFSSDLTGEELHDRLGHVDEISRMTGLHILVAYSKRDEYVPENINKDILLRRMVSAMNGLDFRDGNTDHHDEGAIARGLMLENSNHNLSSDDGDKELFVEAFGKLLMIE
jgi:hypothetical protein